MELIIIPNKYKIHNARNIKSKFPDISDQIESIVWEGNIKPAIAGIDATVIGNLRYEELQFLQVKLKGREDLYSIGKCIYSKIKYPCVIEFLLNDSVIIGVCKFTAGKIDISLNTEKRLFFSHILRKDLLSAKAQEMIDNINHAITSCSNIGDMYNSICSSVSNYQLSGTTKAHVYRLITDMLGKTLPKERNSIMQYCEPYKYYAPIFDNRYNKKKNSNYILVHDYEEIWFCFMKHPATKKVIESRRYRDIEELILSIDIKEYENDYIS